MITTVSYDRQADGLNACQQTSSGITAFRALRLCSFMEQYKRIELRIPHFGTAFAALLPFLSRVCGSAKYRPSCSHIDDDRFMRDAQQDFIAYYPLLVGDVL